jgi:molybdopterin molybdotransferase
LRGERAVFRRTIEVRTRDDITLAAPLTHFMRAIVDWDSDGAWARLTGPQGSGLLTSMALANALLVVPPDRMIVRGGETLRALLLGERSIASASLDV